MTAPIHPNLKENLVGKKRRKAPPAGHEAPPPVEHDGDARLTQSPFAALEGLKKERQAAEREAVRVRRAAEEAARREAEARAAEKAARARARRRGVPDAVHDESVDDATLFARALDGIDQADLYQRKFATIEDPAERLAQQRRAERLSPEEAARMAFEQEMRRSGIERMSSRRIEMAPRPSVAKENVAQVRKQHAAETDDAPVALDGNARKLLERARKHERQHGPLPAVTLRGLSADAALERLIDFLETQALGGTRLVRVITGKGRQSEGEPVLKGAAAQLFEARHEVSLYAPELGRDGDFGAYIVQLRSDEPL